MNGLSEYLRRFTPFVISRIIRTDPKQIPLTIDVNLNNFSLQIRNVVETLNERWPTPNFNDSKNNPQFREQVKDILFNKLNFELVRRRSAVCDGTGLFLKRGRINERTFCSLYPGTVYRPGDPILLQSLGNSFVLRCRDGQMIDGNDRRLSKSIFRSCAFRDYGHNVCDITWIDREPINFLNQGQYINDARLIQGNVQYIDIDIIDWPLALRRWLPYTIYRSGDGLSGVYGSPLRIVALIATRDIEEGEELLSDYISR